MNHLNIQTPLKKYSVLTVILFSWPTTTLPCMYTKSIYIVSHVGTVKSTCLVMTTWLAFTTQCALLPVMNIDSVPVNSDLN